jgi:hypothetical protein
MSATAIGIDRAYRFASKVPAFEISSSDPVDTATGVAVNKTITLMFSMPLHPLDPVNHKIVTIDPDLSGADRIFRLSFGIFIGLSDPDLNGFLVPELPLFLLL